MFLVGYTDNNGDVVVKVFDCFADADNYFEEMVLLGYSSIQMQMRILLKDVSL